MFNANSAGNIHICTFNLQQFNLCNFRFLQRCVLESDSCALLRDDMGLKFADVSGRLVGLINGTNEKEVRNVNEF